MNFVAQVEEQLRDLGTEARRKHPGVKEASERAILQLRTLQNRYVVAVRRAVSTKSPHPTTAIFRSQDVLRPFLLAANYPDASFKLITLALNAFQLLVGGDAICPDDSRNVVRVLSIQANVCCASLGVFRGAQGVNSGAGATGNGAISSLGSSIMTGFTGILGGGKEDSRGMGSIVGYSSSTGHAGNFSHRAFKEDEAICIRILQTLTMIVDARGLDLTKEVLSQCLSICLVLISSGTGFGVDPKSGKAKTVEVRGTSGNASMGGGFGYVRKVRRAATATLQQIVAIVFDRATAIISRISQNNGEDERQLDDAEVLMLKLSSRTLLDLCALAEYRDPADRPTCDKNQNSGTVSGSSIECTGPFAQALTGARLVQQRLQPPPRSACFDLLDMVLRQHVFLFTTKHGTIKYDGKELPNFPSLLCDRVCPLLSNTLTSEFVIGLNGRKSDPNIDPRISGQRSSDCNNPSSFSLLLILTQLASTIITIYGNNKKNPLSSVMHEECHVLLVCLVKFVKAATELLRDLDDFEDGFIYSGMTDNLSDVNPTSSDLINRRAHHSQKGAQTSSLVMWRAAIALEFLYMLISRHFETLLALNSIEANSTLVAVMTEAVGEFAIVASSNKNRITRVAVVSQISGASSSFGDSDTLEIQGKSSEDSKGSQEKLNQNLKAGSLLSLISETFENIQPRITKGARDAMKSCDYWDDEIVVQNSNLQEKEIEKDDQSVLRNNHFVKEKPKNSLLPPCDIGEAVWIGLNFVVSLWKSKLSLNKSKNSKQSYGDEQEEKKEKKDWIDDDAFAPSVAVFQHFLRRFPSSPTVTRRALNGYVCLANNAFPMCKDDDMRRKATLTSLCRLALPCCPKKDMPSQMQDHHIASFSALLQIIHSNYNFIGHDWQIILYTFEQLSCISISSPKLSKYGCRAALSITASFGRLARFTTCMSLHSIKLFVSAVIAISKRANDPRILIEEANPSVTDSNNSFETGIDGNERESLGVKIFSFAGRAFTGSFGGNINQEEEATSSSDDEAAPRISTSKTYGADFCDSVYDKLVASKPNTGVNEFRNIPFPLVLLTDLTLENSYRFLSFSWEVNKYFSQLAATSESAEIRLFAMDAIANFTTSGLAGSVGIGPIQTGLRVAVSSAEHVDDCLKVEKSIDAVTIGECSNELSPAQIPQEEHLAPLCTSIMMAKNRDSAEAGLNTLHLILEGAGHNLSGEAWIAILEAISALSGCYNDSGSIDRSSSDWATCCTLAFRCLKLIVDDFLDELPEPKDISLNTTRTALLDCCVSFGSSKHDVNISLTATGMLWTIADQDPAPSSVDYVLSRLALLSSDDRSEVRNCSVNTLFSCVVGLGHNFSPEQWRTCLSRTIFDVLDQISSRGLVSVGGDKGSLMFQGRNSDTTPSERYKVAVHHSRDSSSKKWSSTQVLMLRGIERVLRQYFGKLVGTTIVVKTDSVSGVEQNNENSDDEQVYWFELAWSHILALALQCSTQVGGRETLEVRLVGVEMLVLCAQVSSKSGIMAVSNPRISTNMKVVNGALRSVRRVSLSKTQQSVQNTVELVVSDDELSAVGKRKRGLFNEVFCVFEKLRLHLSEDVVEEDLGTSSIYMESTSVQVMTKFCQGITKLYECCKDNELLPSIDITCDENSTERKFVELIETLLKKVTGPLGSKYLSQGQRLCLELLKNMASCSSSLALELLVQVGGGAFLWQFGDEPFESKNTDDRTEYETLNFEAATIVSDTCINIKVEGCAKVRVLCKIIDLFSFHISGSAEKTMMHHKLVSYKLLVPVVNGGLQALGFLEMAKKESILSGDCLSLEKVVNKVITFVTLLLSTKGSRRKHYLANTNEILQILTMCSTIMPSSKDVEFGKVLLTGVSESVSLIKTLPATTTYREGVANEVVDDVLQIFKQCFEETSRLLPSNDSLQSIIAPLFESAIQTIEIQIIEESEEISVPPFDINIKIATTLCQSLCEVPFVSDIAVELFPLLCRLMNSGEADLRGAASDLLMKINIGRMLERTKQLELKASSAEHLEHEKIKISQQILSERGRADAAEKRVEELQKLNESLSENVNSLELQKERLEQQVAVLSEGSAYT